jgi:succinate dehydrogenase/fumarate reductase cytochrome b subunit
MNVKTIYKVSGYLSIALGVMAVLCIYRIQYMYYGVALAIFGFIFSGINIFLNEKHYFEQEKYPKGYIGMFLSSLPVIFLMLIIFKFKK